MKLHLTFDIEPLASPISIRQQILLLGSCFAENIGDKLRMHKFKLLQNPAGIQFNPFSIATTLQRAADNKIYEAAELEQHNGLWHSWDHHGSFNHPDAVSVLEQINIRLSEANHVLQHAQWLIITWGSAWVYELAESHQVVANCHKVPQARFSKRMLSTKEIITRYTALIEQLHKINPELKILFTVSPVRYVRDGLVESTRSKAALHLAVQALTSTFSHCFYFPAYEIVTDELRDYRFYERDLVHPNALATDYVWECFVRACLDDESKQCLVALLPILQSLQHRLLHASAEEADTFKINMLTRIQKLQGKYPFLDLQPEREYFKAL